MSAELAAVKQAMTNLELAIKNFARVPQIDSKYKAGDVVIKSGGDYSFTGVVICAFTKLSGQVRYCVENAEGIVHIFSEKQLDACQKI